jgi:2-aminobenzoate-CoA ligase
MPQIKLGPTAHVDTFARDNLPPFDQWPELLLDRPEFQYPEYLNAAVELTDRNVERGFGDRIALIGNGRRRTYKELADWSNRLAHALIENYGVKPGNRVLIRSGNNPALVAAWLAATKAGAVVVNTMPMLRAGELHKIVDKAEIALALTDSRIADELVACAKDSKFLKQVVSFDGTSNHDAELDRIALDKPVKFDAVPTGRDDVALLGFTSGTTGEPKATMHFHRDLLMIADGYAREVLGVTSDDIFVGSPPLAFTFGLGGLAIFPLRFGATATLLESATPANMVQIIETYKATICFTAPTAYRAMLAAMDQGADLSSLRLAVSAGETLPAAVFEDWTRKTGKPILDGIGSTEMLHIFISNRIGDAVPGATGRPVDPGRMASPEAEMKMCSISVEPMPSMISTPVASRNASQTAFGRCSPAETAFRSDGTVLPAASIALYAVGAVKQTVTPCSSIRSASSTGVAFSTSSVDAPAWRGNSSTPPSPKVKAYGGVPVNTSSDDGWST